MKFIIAVALLFIGSVAAQDPTNKALADLLVKRADALIASTHKNIADLKAVDKGHLLETIEHQVKEVEALIKDLKAAAPDAVHKLHHLNVIEEELFYLENRIGEELSVLQQAHVPQPGTDVTTLVHKAEALVKQAKDLVAKHTAPTDAKENKEIQAEVTQIETLVKAILAKPAPADLKKDEEQLAKHEKTLQVLLEKAAHRNPVKTTVTPAH